MFELKYKITPDDIKAVNKRIMWQYFIPYLIVSLAGLAAGIAATVLRPRTEILVLGIILLVLAAVLLVCTVMLLIAPKNFVVSAIIPDAETEHVFVFDDNGITIKTADQSDIKVSYSEINKVKDCKAYALLYIGKEQVLVVKDAVMSGRTLTDLIAYLKGKTDKSGTVSAAEQSTPVESAEAANDVSTSDAAADNKESETPETQAADAEEDEADGTAKAESGAGDAE